MPKSHYDTEEYIQKVMRVIRCDRKEALEIIEDFKKIDRDVNTGAFKSRNRTIANERRERFKKEHRCMNCGRQDEGTLKGLSRCEDCKKRQKENYERKKRENATATE